MILSLSLEDGNALKGRENGFLSQRGERIGTRGALGTMRAWLNWSEGFSRASGSSILTKRVIDNLFSKQEIQACVLMDKQWGKGIFESEIVKGSVFLSPGRTWVDPVWWLRLRIPTGALGGTLQSWPASREQCFGQIWSQDVLPKAANIF